MNPVDKLDCAICVGDGNLRDIVFPKLDMAVSNVHIIRHIIDVTFLRQKTGPASNQVSLKL